MSGEKNRNVLMACGDYESPPIHTQTKPTHHPPWLDRKWIESSSGIGIGKGKLRGGGNPNLLEGVMDIWY